MQTLPLLAVTGHSLAALAYLLLCVLLLARGAPAASGRLLVAASGAEAAWAAIAALGVAGASIPAPAALLSAAEAARFLLWSLFLLSLLAPHEAGEEPRSPLRRGAGLGIAMAAALAAASVATDVLAGPGQAAFALKAIDAVFAIACLEQVYRNSLRHRRWALKYLAIAVVGLFGFDLLLYSEALLFSRMNPALWVARSYANAIVMPMVAVAAARNRSWNLDISVSRGVVFHTTTLMIAGAFMIVMAAGGSWVRYFGGQWGEVAEALLLFGAAIGLLVLLLSGTVRARVRVFVAKNFYSMRYDYRSEWMKLTALLSDAPGAPAPREPVEVRAIEGLGALVESPGGALWQREDSGDFVCAARRSYAGATPRIPAAHPMVAFLRARGWVVSLPQWRVEPHLYGGLELPREVALDERNWLLVPLMLGDDVAGFIVLTASLAPAEIDWEVRDALKVAARQIASYLGVRRAIESLVQARQFESFNRMSAFVVHDLKNLVAQLSLLMANAARHRDNPEFQQDMLDTVENVLGRMQSLLLQLRAESRPIDARSRVRLAPLLESAIRSKRGVRPEPKLSVEPDAAQATVMAHGERLERVVGHLVQNAAEATPPDGSIRVRLGREGGQALIEIEDTGAGMSAEFIRERLFKPFQSTKERGMGIGTFESRTYVGELGGSLDVDSRVGTGTVFRIRLPLVAAAAE